MKFLAIWQPFHREHAPFATTINAGSKEEAKGILNMMNRPRNAKDFLGIISEDKWTTENRIKFWRMYADEDTISERMFQLSGKEPINLVFIRKENMNESIY